MAQKSTVTFQDAMALVTDTCDSVMVDRQRKYGPDNIRLWGLMGVAVRATDKVMRLRELLLHGHGADASDESVRDTLVDLCNYARIGLMQHDGIWGLPLAETEDRPNGAPAR